MTTFHPIPKVSKAQAVKNLIYAKAVRLWRKTLGDDPRCSLPGWLTSRPDLINSDRATVDRNHLPSVSELRKDTLHRKVGLLHTEAAGFKTKVQQ